MSSIMGVQRRYGYWMNEGWPTPAKLTAAYVQAVEDAIADGTWQ